MLHYLKYICNNKSQGVLKRNKCILIHLNPDVTPQQSDCEQYLTQFSIFGGICSPFNLLTPSYVLPGTCRRMYDYILCVIIYLVRTHTLMVHFCCYSDIVKVFSFY